MDVREARRGELPQVKKEEQCPAGRQRNTGLDMKMVREILVEIERELLVSKWRAQARRATGDRVIAVGSSPSSMDATHHPSALASRAR